MPGPARRTAEEVVLALTDAGFFRISHRSDSARYVVDIRTTAMPTAPAPGRRVIRSQQALEAIHTLLNVHGAGGFAEKTGCSSTGVMPTPRHGIPDTTPSYVARSMASHYWQPRSASARRRSCPICKSVGRLGSPPCPIAVTPSHRSGNPLCRGWAYARCASLTSTAWTR
jgi:hypothetical protein